MHRSEPAASAPGRARARPLRRQFAIDLASPVPGDPWLDLWTRPSPRADQVLAQWRAQMSVGSPQVVAVSERQEGLAQDGALGAPSWASTGASSAGGPGEAGDVRGDGPCPPSPPEAQVPSRATPSLARSRLTPGVNLETGAPQATPLCTLRGAGLPRSPHPPPAHTSRHAAARPASPPFSRREVHAQRHLARTAAHPQRAVELRAAAGDGNPGRALTSPTHVARGCSGFACARCRGPWCC